MTQEVDLVITGDDRNAMEITNEVIALLNKFVKMEIVVESTGVSRIEVGASRVTLIITKTDLDAVS